MTAQSGIQNFKPRGFSLIELMVTVAIIAILSSIGMVVYSNAQRGARMSKRHQDLTAIKTALEVFRSTRGAYPNVQNVAQFQCVNTLPGTNNSLAPTFMPIVPDDPDGTHCYEYRSDATGANPTATEYKLRTDDNIATTEMDWQMFNQLDALLDPAKDANPGNGCTLDALTAAPTGGTNYTWAYYTPGACAY